MRCSAMLVFMVAMLLPCWTSAAIVRTLPEVLYAPVTPTGSITIAIGFEPLQVVEVPTNLNFRFGGISIDDRSGTWMQQIGKQSHLLSEIILKGLMVIQVVTRDVGESASRKAHTIQAVLS